MQTGATIFSVAPFLPYQQGVLK